MKYEPGQKVIINKDCGQKELVRDILKKLDPPFVVTIKNIQSDPHCGRDMYIFNEITWGWYEYEVDGLYIKPKKIESRFEILDL